VPLNILPKVGGGIFRAVLVLLLALLFWVDVVRLLLVLESDVRNCCQLFLKGSVMLSNEKLPLNNSSN
jgi:hypothetical protein